MSVRMAASMSRLAFPPTRMPSSRRCDRSRRLTSSSPVSSGSAADLHSEPERAREALAAWADWTSGHRHWPFGKLEPHESLYDFQGSAIFLKEVGVHRLLFFRSDIHDDGDFFVAAAVSDDERDALKEGRLSVRGAFTGRTCWL